MGKILLTAELGQGLGHMSRLAPIASELAAVGHQAMFAVRDVRTATRFLREADFPVLQAPYWQLPAWRRERPFIAATYTDLLARHGYDNEDDLSAMVQAWDNLIDLVQPDLIVADHSPTVCLAAADRVPVVLVGDGFTIPPASSASFGSLSTAEPIADAEQVLRTVQLVQQRRRRTVADTLPAAFVSSARFLVTFPELDPYRHQRDEQLVGPMASWEAPTESPGVPHAFAYLDASYTGVAEILTAFVHAGVRCSVYLRHYTDELVNRLRATGIEVHDSPQPLSSVLPHVSAIVHHAGLNTSTTALASGRPQLVLPRYLEQDLNASALQELGVGRILGGRLTTQSIGKSLRGLIEDATTALTSQRIAHELYSRGADGSLPRIIEHCQQLI